jgi:hypothetical protein
LDALRAQLDAREEGARERWLAALVPLARPEMIAARAAGMTSAAAPIVAGVTLVKKTLWAALAAIVVISGWQLATVVFRSHAGHPEAALSAPARIDHSGSNSPQAEASPGQQSESRLPLATTTADSSPAAMGSLSVRLRWYRDRRPAVGRTVEVICANDPAPREEPFLARTDTQGRAHFPALFSGATTLILEDGRRLHDLEEAIVVSGELREIELTLGMREDIRGQVVDSTGDGVVGAEIWAHESAKPLGLTHEITRSGIGGSFTLEGFSATFGPGRRS